MGKHWLVADFAEAISQFAWQTDG